MYRSSRGAHLSNSTLVDGDAARGAKLAVDDQLARVKAIGWGRNLVKAGRAERCDEILGCLVGFADERGPKRMAAALKRRGVRIGFVGCVAWDEIYVLAAT